MKSPYPIYSSPHLHSNLSTRLMMTDVLIALIPALIASGWLFGLRALVLELVCVATCLVAEAVTRIVLGRPQTIFDLSCVVTGLLLAFNLPSTIPLWQAIFGCIVAIVLVKQLFGGIGYNFVNPALAARIVLLVSFPATMASYTPPLTGFMADAVSAATPLQLEAGQQTGYSMVEMLFGMRPGSLGETCIVALVLGGVYLMLRRVISPIIPTIYIGTTFLLHWLIDGDAGLAFYKILSGGLFLGAIFMATDYTTSPVHRNGKIVYALGCALITILIREYASLPEGVSFAILIMNIATPLIERATWPKPFGAQGRLYALRQRFQKGGMKAHE